MDQFQNIYGIIADKRLRKTAREAKCSTDVEAGLAFIMSLDELGKQAANVFKATESKWCRLSLKGVKSNIFWLLVGLHNEVSGIIEGDPREQG